MLIPFSVSLLSTAMEYASLHPDRIQSISLISPPFFRDENEFIEVSLLHHDQMYIPPSNKVFLLPFMHKCLFINFSFLSCRSNQQDLLGKSC